MGRYASETSGILQAFLLYVRDDLGFPWDGAQVAAAVLGEGRVSPAGEAVQRLPEIEYRWP